VTAKKYSRALIYHLQWKVQLKKFLDGEGHFDIAELFPENCKLGEWLHSDEISKYASPAEIRQIEKVHTKLHQEAKRVYALKKIGEDLDAQQKLKKMEATSMKLVSLLTTLKKISEN
jgi:Chemoreceptor zinc-binding domain